MADDDYDLAFRPYVSYTLILLNISVYILQVMISGFTSLYALVPAEIVQGQNLHTLITSMFLHADPYHLFSNMWFFYIFSGPVEKELGPLVFIPFYLFSGVIGSLGHILITFTLESMFFPFAPYIMALGASGAIFGVMAAFAYLIPRKRLQIWSGYGETGRDMAAWNFIIFYFAIELVFLVLSFGSGIAHGAHVFGFVGGYLFAIVFRRAKLAREKGRAGDEFFVPGYT